MFGADDNLIAQQRFIELFVGNRNAYGVHIPATSKKEGEKAQGKSFTRMERVLPDIYEKHLAGTTSIGIIPVNNEGKVSFCVLDVDTYPLNPKRYCTLIAKYGLPLLAFRSKSGGLHIYCFFQDPVEADLALQKMDEFRCMLGLSSKTETFPKQSKLTQGKQVGNWINLPYFDVEHTERYAYDDEGKPMTFPDAMAKANAMKITINGIDRIIHSTPMNSAPPCIQALYLGGIITKESKQRNNFLFNVAVYLKSRFPSEWQDKLADVNNSLPDPLSERELHDTVILSHDKASYTYQCNQSLLKDWCDKEVCRCREFGKYKGKVSECVFGQLTQVLSDPPYYKWLVSDKEMVFFSEEELRNQDKFLNYCMRNLHTLPQKVKNEVWFEIVNTALKTMKTEDVENEDDLSEIAMWRSYVVEYISEHVFCSSIGQIKYGYTFKDDDGYYFKAVDLVKFIQDIKSCKVMTASQQRYKLLSYGMVTKRKYDNVSGKQINLWFCSHTVFNNLKEGKKDEAPTQGTVRESKEAFNRDETIRNGRADELRRRVSELTVEETDSGDLLDFTPEEPVEKVKC